MATSNDQPRARQSEPVQFWLAIAMVSLALHSVFLFGIQRWAKVAVLQPETGGAIEVEVWDSSPAKVEKSDGAIAQVRSEPDVVQKTRVEAKPPVQAQPQPSEPEPEVIQQPDRQPKPEKSIAPTSQPKKQSQVQSSPKPKVQPSPKSRPTTPSPTRTTPATLAPVPKDLPNLDGQGKTRSFVTSIGPEGPQQLPTGGADDRKATLVLQQPLPPLVISSDFVNDVAQTMQVAITFDVQCSATQGLICPPGNIKMTLSNHAPNVRVDGRYFDEFKDAVEKWLQEEVKASSLVYEPDPLGKTDFIKKPPTYWNIQVEMQVRK